VAINWPCRELTWLDFRITANIVANNFRVSSFAFGDTYLIGSGLVSAFHFGINRSNGVKSADNFYSWRDLGSDAGDLSVLYTRYV
jgi:hypothetical protein